MWPSLASISSMPTKMTVPVPIPPHSHQLFHTLRSTSPSILPFHATPSGSSPATRSQVPSLETKDHRPYVGRRGSLRVALSVFCMNLGAGLAARAESGATFAAARDQSLLQRHGLHLAAPAYTLYPVASPGRSTLRAHAREDTHDRIRLFERAFCTETSHFCQVFLFLDTLLTAPTHSKHAYPTHSSRLCRCHVFSDCVSGAIGFWLHTAGA